jgi:hypothetical protein
MAEDLIYYWTIAMRPFGGHERPRWIDRREFRNAVAGKAGLIDIHADTKAALVVVVAAAHR